MSGVRLSDDLIGKASTLKELIEQLISLYKQVPALLDGDKRALAASDLMELEALSLRKVAIADGIEEHFIKLQASVRDIERSSKAIVGIQKLADPPTLSAVLTWLQSLGVAMKQQEGFAAQVFLHLTAGLQGLGEQLLQMHRSLKPALEANKYMMEKVLAFKQESYRFWQDVANVAMSSYNAQGAQTSTVTRSVLQIRA